MCLGMGENDDADTVSGHAHAGPSSQASSSTVFPRKAPPPPPHTTQGVPRDRQNEPAPPLPLARAVNQEEAEDARRQAEWDARAAKIAKSM